MKLSKLLSIAIASTVILVSCNNKKSSVKLKNDIDSLSYCIGVSIGENLSQADLPSFNTEVFKQAVEDALAKKSPKIAQEQANMFIQQYFGKLQVKNSEKNMKDGQEFLKKNKERSGVITTASGLQYEIVKEGTGSIPTKEDMVSINYKGTLVDGTVFDSSYDRGQPATFAVGGVIPGFTEALQLMKVGSKYKVYIPSELGYGSNVNPRGKIKPNSVLIFELELLSIEKPKADSKPAAGKK
jgi:FKBP-type peptidyl-prolyl cis-trans isomerase